MLIKNSTEHGKTGSFESCFNVEIAKCYIKEDHEKLNLHLVNPRTMMKDFKSNF